MELHQTNMQSSVEISSNHDKNSVAVSQRQLEEESEQPLGLEKDWVRVMVDILGLPFSWVQRPPLQYTDPQLYPIREVSKKVAEYRRVDSVLTKDGKKFKKLKVQAAEYLKDEANCTWQRHSIAEVSTLTMKISKLPLLAMARFDQRFGDAAWVPWASWLWYFLLWLLALCAILIWFVWRLMQHSWRIAFPKRLEVVQYNYHSFCYEDDRYARIASNPTSNRKLTRRVRYDQPVDGDRSSSYDLLRPRMLMKANGDAAPSCIRNFPPDLKYVFVAFSFTHFPLDNNKQLSELIRVGNKVTQELGYEYFWVSASCMGLNDAELALTQEQIDRIEEQDIYGISDVVRGAAKVIIVLPDSTGSPCPKLRELSICGTMSNPDGPAGRAVFPFLQEWGARVWTLPEVLLGPNKDIRICWKEDHTIQWYELEKKHFPGYVWKDKDTSMQMVRHYNNAALTRLEFVKIAMACLMKRQESGIQWHYPGDLSYVLMGFLRIRPPINKYDSSLQAFARLSLPADNDRLMERFLCLQWHSRQMDWESMEDAFKADLWSIEPYIQISGVGENDTIIIEKAWGAHIEVAKFDDMSAINIGYLRRLQGVSAGLTVVPDLANWMAKRFRRVKYKRVLPRLYCIEGFMTIDKIEEKLFGTNIGFLSWSTNASTLSKHEQGSPVYEPKTELSGDSKRVFAGLHPRRCIEDVDLEAQGDIAPEAMAHDDGTQRSRDSIEAEDGRIATYPIIGRQPWTICACGSAICTCANLTDRQLEAMGRTAMGEDKIFTLIDTATMTVTLLTAAWPPQALIACGVEGGMERVLACSYDWTTGVLYKECVLRFPGAVLEQMHRLPSIRLGYKRTLQSADIAPRQSRRR